MDTVATNTDLTVLQTARLGASLGAALGDAGIVAWDVKNDSDFWRPDTAMYFAGLGGANDPAWQPLWPDPLFQSYISGHSTFSMAAATVLADFFGTDDISFCATADPNAHDANNNPLTGAAALHGPGPNLGQQPRFGVHTVITEGREGVDAAQFVASATRLELGTWAACPLWPSRKGPRCIVLQVP